MGIKRKIDFASEPCENRAMVKRMGLIDWVGGASLG